MSDDKKQAIRKELDALNARIREALNTPGFDPDKLDSMRAKARSLRSRLD